MKLRLTTSRADRGFEQNEGDVIDVDAAEGKRLLESRQAEIVREGGVETASQNFSNVETAARRPRRK